MPYCLAVILYIVFLLAPGTSGLYDGVPLSRLHELITIAILPLFFLLLPVWRRSANRIHLAILFLIILKIAIGSASLKEGLIGSYYTTRGEVVTQERSTEFFDILPNATRIDKEINFKQEGYPKNAHPFPVWFFNDNSRFNETSADMRLTPFSATWKGFVHVPEGGRTLAVESDGNATVDVLAPHKEAVVPITISYTPSDESRRYLRLVWSDMQGPSTDSSSVSIQDALYPTPYTIEEIRTNHSLKILDAIVKLIALMLCIFLIKEGITKTPFKQWWHTWSPYLFASYAISIGIIMRALISNAQSTYFNFLDGGNDPLTYETYARHIQFTGMWGMQTLEKGSYYYQPYYYLVTLFHYLGGEGIFSIIALQGIIFAITGICLAIIGKQMLGKDTALKKTWPLLFLPLLITSTVHMTTEVFLIFPSIMGAFGAVATGGILLSAKNKTGHANWLFLLAGITLGFGILNRFNFLSWIPFIILWIVLSFGKRSTVPVIAFLVGVAIFIGPMMVRNKVVDGSWRLVSRSNPTINFILSLPPEVKSYVGNYNHGKITRRTEVIFDERATPAIEWILDNAREYMRLLGKKIREVIVWFPWQCAVFLIGSCMYLFCPRLFAPRAKRKDYILIGMFPIMQIANIVLMSNNNMRYHLPAALFMTLWASLSVMMAQNAIQSFNETRKRRVA